MEGEERNADRQDDLNERQFAFETQRMRQFVRRDEEEIEVFEDAENAQMDRHRRRQNAAPAAGLGGGDQEPGDIADGTAEQQQKAEAPVPLRIEKIAGRHQQPLLRRKAFLQRRHRRRHDHDQKEQQEPEGRKQHVAACRVTAGRAPGVLAAARRPGKPACDALPAAALRALHGPAGRLTIARQRID